jgi:hypothetical protein
MVIERTDDVHASYQGLGTTCQSTRSADQMMQALAKGRIETFNESRIDIAPAVGAGVITPFPFCVALIKCSTIS